MSIVSPEATLVEGHPHCTAKNYNWRGLAECLVCRLMV